MLLESLHCKHQRASRDTYGFGDADWVQMKPLGAMRRVKCRSLLLHMPPITVFQMGLVRPIPAVFGRALVTKREGLQNRENNSRV